MTLNLVVKNACLYRCGEGGIPHVWESSRIPPHNNDRCMCGAVTWKEGVALIYQKRLKERIAQDFLEPPECEATSLYVKNTV